nr:MAG TPA: Complement C5-like protein [Caudoviricetes sp.]
MSNVVKQLTPNPVNHEHGENGCCKNPRAWEMEMMHQVWAAGLHDAANCFHDALKAKWELDAKKVIATNGDLIRSMTDEELAEKLPYLCDCPKGRYDTVCANFRSCFECWLSLLKAPVACEESQKQAFPLAEKKGNAK